MERKGYWESQTDWHVCRMAHGPVAGTSAVLAAHAQSAGVGGTINLSTGSVSISGAVNEKEILVRLCFSS